MARHNVGVGSGVDHLASKSLFLVGRKLRPVSRFVAVIGDDAEISELFALANASQNASDVLRIRPAAEAHLVTNSKPCSGKCDYFWIAVFGSVIRQGLSHLPKVVEHCFRNCYVSAQPEGIEPRSARRLTGRIARSRHWREVEAYDTRATRPRGVSRKRAALACERFSPTPA